jgi:hypothetical protein
MNSTAHCWHAHAQTLLDTCKNMGCMYIQRTPFQVINSGSPTAPYVCTYVRTIYIHTYIQRYIRSHMTCIQRCNACRKHSTCWKHARKSACIMHMKLACMRNSGATAMQQRCNSGATAVPVGGSPYSNARQKSSSRTCMYVSMYTYMYVVMHAYICMCMLCMYAHICMCV